ncbi:MAG: YihY/virulence factor BrkB family protein [Desulforhopalus sp.]
MSKTPLSGLLIPPSLITWADKQSSNTSRLTAAARYLVRLLIIVIREFRINELSLRSGALTYTILLSLVPMLAMSTAVVKGLGGGDQLRKAAYTYIDTLEKTSNTTYQITSEGDTTQQSQEVTSSGADLTNHLRSAADKLFDYVDRTNFATLGSFGVLGILLSVLLVLGHIESAMNAIWKVTAGRSILRKLADYLTLLVLMPISINVAFAAGAFLESPALASKMDNLIPVAWLQALLLKPVPIFFIAISFFAMYIFFPNTRVRPFPAILGSTLAAILWFIMQNIYINLQVGVAKYNAIYGSFATLPLFLVWMYLGWMFILAGAQAAFAMQNIHSYRLTPVLASPSLKLGAAFDIMDLIYSRFTNRQSLTNEHLASELPHYTQAVLEDVAEQLNSAGLFHKSESDGRLLPTMPGRDCTSKEIIQTIFGSAAADTPGGERSQKAIEKAGLDINQDFPPQSTRGNVQEKDAQNTQAG